MTPFTIPTQKVEDEFDAYINPEWNRRIILSGRFGAGKTTFIKRFFHTRTEKYFHIHLYPVNYSVASNEDIFELIKYDILYELISFPDLMTDDYKPRWVDTIYFLDQKEVFKIFAPFINYIPKIGKTLSDLIEPIKQLSELYEETKSKLTRNDLKDVMEFISQIEGTSGNLYENDFYTKLITSFINSIQANGKKIIITIDDLDRIDPEHIFRILNVFSAHFDQRGNKNKFDIDKVITCFDSKNVRKIFANRYGQDVDFTGYIDKFHSRGIFYFDNSESVNAGVEQILNSINFDIKLQLTSDTYKPILRNILSTLVLHNAITLRSLLKYHDKTYQPTPKKISFTVSSQRTNSNQFVIFNLVQFLCDLYGNNSNLLEALDRCQFNIEEWDDSLYERFLGDLLLINNHSCPVDRS